MDSKSLNKATKPIHLVAALDAGTQSTRCIVFDSNGSPVASHSVAMDIITPKSGWAEHDPVKSIESAKVCLETAISSAREKHPSAEISIGITNHRESTVAWRKSTGTPLSPLILWLDTRTKSIVQDLKPDYCFRNTNGLPISTYFSAVKMKWIIDNIPPIAQAIKEDDCAFGTVDSWLIYSLTRQESKFAHLTDVTNASRTMLMDIKSLQWDPTICQFFSIPKQCLAKIVSSAQEYSAISPLFSSKLTGIPITGCLGDQQSALVGQLCTVGTVKVTYGTGCFILTPTGNAPIIPNDDQLLSTVGHQLGPEAPVIYALEKAIPVAGSGISWFQKKILRLSSPSAISDLAEEAHSRPNPSNGACFLASFGEMQFRGLTDGVDLPSMCWALLSSFCFETALTIDTISEESGVKIDEIRVDGGITKSNITMQIQADLLGCGLVLPSFGERTVFGAFIAAAIGSGLFSNYQEAIKLISYSQQMEFRPKWDDAARKNQIGHYSSAKSKSKSL